jgi:hypothetical protein
VQVHYGEGVAIRTGPEPCVGTCEGMCGSSLSGNREVSGWPADGHRGSASERRRVVTGDARVREV